MKGKGERAGATESARLLRVTSFEPHLAISKDLGRAMSTGRGITYAAFEDYDSSI